MSDGSNEPGAGKHRPHSSKRTELAKIHIGAQQLGLDGDTYREMLWTVARVRSARDLDQHGRRQVLAHLRARGAVFHRAGIRASRDRAPLLSKVFALLGDRKPEYAEGILRQMYGQAAPARLEWASPEQLRKVVAALSYDQRRKQP